MISFHNCYHGSTHGALSMMGSELFKTNYRPLLPDTRRLTFNDDGDLANITEHTACVLVEPIQSEAGVVAARPEWLKQLRDRCQAVGALLIFDEVQTGFGRTGTFFAFEQYGLAPDILTLGKGMGGGMPAGAFVSSAEIMRNLTHTPVLGHMTTFGGHPVCCAAALANLEVIRDEKLYERALHIGETVKKKLVHPAIKELRACGGLIAVDFGTESLNMEIIQKCIDKGVITDWFLFNSHSMRIAPPLTITDEELSVALRTMIEVLAGMG